MPGAKQINLIYGGKTPILPAAELAKMGFKVLLYSTPALYVAVRALKESMSLLQRSHDLSSISDESVTFKQFQALIEEPYLGKYAAKPAQRSAAGRSLSLAPMDLNRDK